MNKYQKCLRTQRLIGFIATVGSVVLTLLLGEWLGEGSLIIPVVFVPFGLYCMFSKGVVLEFYELYEEDEEDWV